MPGSTWRGWADRGAPEGRPVTSGRLPSSAKPRSRLFPKTRSWFALDAPLELLSPLSVLRVFFALATVAWPVIGLTAPWSTVDARGIAGVSVVTAVIWVVLLKIKAVDGDAYDTTALKDAIRWSQEKKVPFDLLVEDNKQFRTLHIDYQGGLRYPHLEPIGNGPHSLDAILAAK